MLLGLLGGAAAGFMIATVLVVGWYDVLGFGYHGGDGMSGLSTYLLVTPLLILVGAIAGAVWLGGKAAPGAESPGLALAAAMLALAVAYLFLEYSGLFT